ncbi:SHOCT domain-containing protein [Halpernia sp.]|uniref:SHOCT domain-containing protein n=1 Tax=Halpernia sp. TaxID=2782209 RepID=UPI003A8FC7A3
MNTDLSDLEKLNELKEKGILTIEEFENKKKQILDSSSTGQKYQNQIQNIKDVPAKKKSGCLKIFLIIAGLLFFIGVIGAIISPKTEKINTESTNEDFLLSEKVKTQEQKIDSAKLQNKKFNELSVVEQVSKLEKELENKNLTKIQKEEINIEIKNIKELEFAKKNISAWDGSNPKLERTIKKAMNDPDSYEHVSTTFAYKKNEVIATMIYRGKNSFGAKVLGKATGTFDYDGNLLEVKDN